VLAARGEWVTNEKTLLERAGLRSLDAVLASLGTGPDALAAALDAAAGVLEEALGRAGR
jgi:hypothetical protein